MLTGDAPTLAAAIDKVEMGAAVVSCKLRPSRVMDGRGRAIAADGHLSDGLRRMHPRDRCAQFPPDSVLEDLP
jgi:hypothetical protein